MDYAIGCVLPSMTLRLQYLGGALPPPRSPMRLAFHAGFRHTAIMDPPADNPGSEHARGVAFEALRGPLTGYFRRRIREQDEVLDLVQEVFLRLSNRGDFDDIDNLRGYVFQVAASVLTDRQRRRVVRQQDAHVEFDAERMGDVEIGPDRILAGRDALNVAMAVLNQMPERTRTIFVLRRLEGMRYLDISARLGLSVSAVEKHMVRAVAQLAAAGDIR